MEQRVAPKQRTEKAEDHDEQVFTSPERLGAGVPVLGDERPSC